MSSPAHAVYGDDFRAREKSLPGWHAPWVRALRARAMETFMERGLPDTRVEAWKYTDVRSLARHHFTASPGSTSLDESALPSRLLTAEPVHRLVFVDGRHAPALNPFNTQLNGVTLTSLAYALVNRPEELEPWLGRNTDPEKPGFNALNTAFMSDGAYLRLAPGVTLDHPVHLLFIATGKPDTVATVRNVIVAAAGSKAQIVESYISLNDAAYLTNTVTELIVGEGADIEHHKLEQESESAYHMAGIYVSQHRDSRYTSHNIALGGRLVRNDLHVTLDEPGTDCTLNGLYLTRGRQHVDNHTRIDHCKPRASSREWYKGVLDERSRAVFNGRVVVHKDAQQTDARQSNHNLLLSNEAEADAQPQLEIYADDVKCSHGCTVGRLDEEALFYLRSRGIDPASARNFLIHAFAADVLQRIRIAPVRRYLEEQLMKRLNGGELPGLYGNREGVA
jgi:Fe-S cluster assembly protein SufD